MTDVASGGTVTRSSEMLGALATTVAHVRSETTNSVETIMGTVSSSVCYLMPDVSQSALPITPLLERDQVAEYYREERSFLEVVDACDLVELSSDWYVFHEGVSTTREVATGKTFQHTYAVLFPVAADGIIGEILWPRQSLNDLYAGRRAAGAGEALTPDELLALRRRHQATHDRYLAALRSGDVGAARALWSDDARIAVRVGGPGTGTVRQGAGSATVEQRVRELCTVMEAPEVTVLQRVVGEWYLFADWVIRGRMPGSDATVELRIASIHPMTRSSEIAGELGYGLDHAVVA